MTPELHPLGFFLPENTRLLMLGSFPPPKARWKMNFYYPNFQNDMWRIYGTVFFNNKDYFLNSDKTAFNQEKIERFLRAKGIAVFDSGFDILPSLKDGDSSCETLMSERKNIQCGI